MSNFSATLRDQVSIQTPTTARDEAGQPIDGWVELCKPWTDIRSKGGLETIRAGAVTSTVNTSVRMRYRLDIDASMQVVEIRTGTRHKIVAVLPDKRRGYIDLVCEVIG